jgi:hypothetical protein
MRNTKAFHIDVRMVSPIVLKEIGNLRVLPDEPILQTSMIAQNCTNLMNPEHHIVNNI